VGAATLLCIATAAVRLPGHGWTALGLSVCLALPGFWLLGRDGITRAVATDGLIVGVVVVAATSVPFLLAGHLGILGAQVDEDLGFHLAWAEALSTGDGAFALIRQVDPGYPIAPHALAAAFARPFGVLPAFTGFLVAVPVLTSLTALTALRDIVRPWRWIAAVATGLPYLLASYFAEGSFKEPALALVVLAFVLCLRELLPRTAPRAGLPLAVTALSAVLIFSYGGLAWPLGVAGAWLVAELLSRRREWPRWLRATIPALALGAGLLAAGLLAELGRLRAMNTTGRFPGQGTSGFGGNFVGDVSPWEVLGGWPVPNFLLAAEHSLLVDTATVLAGLVVAYAAVSWVRRRDLVVPAAVVASLLIYACARDLVAPYFSVKTLAVVAPLITLMAVQAMFAGLPGLTRARRVAPWRLGGLARGVVAVVFVGVLGWSSLLALRNASVSATGHADEVRSLRSLLSRGATVALIKDNYLRWELLGVRMTNFAPYNYRSDVSATLRPGKPYGPFDFDSLASADLDRFRFALTVRGPYASALPSNWRVVRRTRSFEVWERRGPTAPREIIKERGAPGAVLDCHHWVGRRLSRRVGVAAVRPTPVVGPSAAWRMPGGVAPSTTPFRAAVLPSGRAFAQALALRPGAWDLSLQYWSPVPLRVRAGGLRARLPAVTEPWAQYWPVGSVASAGGPVAVTVRAEGARFGAIKRATEVNQVVASPVGWPVRLVPLRRACGRYVDWLRFG
jgi:hypothetical protein